MIKDVFTSATMVARLEAGPIGHHLDSLSTALQKLGYATTTIRSHLREAHVFGCWLREKRRNDEISELMLELYLADLSSQKEPLTPSRRQRIAAAVHHLLSHLHQSGVVIMQPVESLPETEGRQWLIRYQDYLEKVSGLAPKTIQKLLFFANRLLETMSQQGEVVWSAFTADKITAFLQAEIAPRKGTGPRTPATSLRSFLRFLVLQGRLAAGLELSIPTVRRWSHSALPQRLSETEINRLLASCANQTATGRRNYAILLLLSRLGLRAKEVTKLRLEDVDWIQGNLLAHSSKTHSQRILPLPQDVGEALLSYIQNGRPQTTAREVFLTALPPYLPIKNSAVISMTIKRLMVHAGIKRPSGGAHLLRHSAATQMVNRGASFKEVADVLGHRQLETTGIYAKLDLATLSQVALPWPGAVQ
jgi:site-specific recombinase XerD